ncbi:SH3 domain-containing protein [Methylorubrum extorquens]|uniref:SH3 domain-containing protein n=1 Tax=Methylorubrum extorquens TaxID=408 RepID=UPI003CC957FC
MLLRATAKMTLLALATASLVAASGGVGAAAQNASYVKVTGLSAGHVVWVRSEPMSSAKKLGFLPAKARHIRSYGCMRLAASGWCEVRYRGTRGWVSKHYLKPDTAQRV